MKNVFVVGHNPFFNDSFWKPATVEQVLEYFKNKDSIAVDTETSGRDPHVKKLLTLQLGDASAQFVIDLRHIDVKLFKPLLEEKLLLLHNSKFDYKFLKAAGIYIEKIYDTMLAECVIYNGYFKFGYGLAALVKRYCNEEMSKETRGDFFKLSSNYLTDEQIRYAAKDVQHLHDIKAQQETNLKLYDLEYCANLEFEAVKALADIEWNGMYLDKEEWSKIAEKYTELCTNLEFELDSILIGDKGKKFKANGVLSLFDERVRQLHYNYSSPTQVLSILHKLGFKVDDTNDRTLTKLLGQHPFIDKLQEYRGAITIVNRYGYGFLDYINKHTGRVHTDFWSVLNTGRVSSGNDDMNAPNLQNIPADNKFRNCFKARPGFLWVSIDYSSQELRLMADGSKEEGFIDVLNRGEDLHCYAGSMMFKRPITKADKDLRNKAKTINFGSKRL